jgi:phage tail sheath protein FI
MPEYLAPGVYVEEVSFRQKSIEGVSTSVAGFVGPTRYGPTSGTPELLTSFSDFSRIYGGVDRLWPGGNETENYVAHAVRAFFDNGGARLYVTRIYEQLSDTDDGKAKLGLDSPEQNVLRARFPGIAGNMTITFAVRASANIRVGTGAGTVINGVRAKDVLYRVPAGGGTAGRGVYDLEDTLGGLRLAGPGQTAVLVSALPDGDAVHRLTVTVTVRRPGQFEDDLVYEGMNPAPGTRNSLVDLFTANPRAHADALTVPFAIETSDTSGAAILATLVGDDVLDLVGLSVLSREALLAFSPQATRPTLASLSRTVTLLNGDDGQLPPAQAYQGEDDGPEKTGLKTFEDIDEISIVAAPGATAGYVDDTVRPDAIMQALIGHCQIVMKYRVAVLESGDNQILSDVRTLRGKFDSTHAALYYPWVTIADPLDPAGRGEIQASPAGFVSGIYARSDILHGVFKAPANEVAVGAIDFERILNKSEQDVLNPLGINCFRFFEGRGFRLWGARTISSDPEWKYVSVRRYFAYLEHSIDRGTQWAVFENNSEPLWANVRRTIEDFLTNEWRNGALMGTKPEEAFFVRCDRTTMTQNDFDNGRLICLIGVAVVKPAEFVIFRIGQMTADSKR